MKEINDPAAPSPPREAILMDQMKTFLLYIAKIKEELESDPQLYWHSIYRIEKMDVSGDDSVEKLTSKILQCIEKMDTGLRWESVLLLRLEKTIKELYPELWVVNVCGLGIVIADSVLESKFAPHAVDLSLPELESRNIIKGYIGSRYRRPYYPMVGNHELGINHQFVKWQGKIYEEEKENRHSHPPNHAVIKIDDNGVLKVDKRETKRLNTFLKFYGNRIFQSHSTDENRVAKWAALHGMQWAQLSVLGNPLDKLSQSTGIDTMELSMGKACSITVWTSIFFLNFLFAAMLTWSLPLRIPAYSMLGFSLLYYILALIVAMSGYSVAWGGSAKMSGLLFVFGGATSLVLLLSIIIIVVLYAAWCSSPNEVGGELTEKHSPECIIKFQDN
ncbi:hypothetical protein JHK85_007330 [Glycine max]|nr:hypothetical protein JHK85_007330 [Glycine max]